MRLSSKMSLARELTTADQFASAVSDHSASGRRPIEERHDAAGVEQDRCQRQKPFRCA
jgi:hypothetical protein